MFVVFKSFLTTKAVDFISKWMRGRLMSSRKTKTIAVMNKHFFLPQQKVTNAIFDEAKVLTEATALQLFNY